MRRLSGLILAAALAACSPKPKEAPPPAQKPMVGASTQALVTAQAHLMGEEPRYGASSWARLADDGDLIVWELQPGDPTPVVTAKIRGERIASFVQHGVLTRKSLAALAAGAGAPPGEHGPTADKVLALIAEAKAKAQPVSGELGGTTWTAVPTGDAVRAAPKP